MDAVMVVHKLQRLAAVPSPSAALAAKLPRVAVGLCYFIDHPELGVRRQAAHAVQAVTQQHYLLLRKSSCCCPLAAAGDTASSSSSAADAAGNENRSINACDKKSTTACNSESNNTDICSNSNNTGNGEANLIQLLQKHIDSEDTIVRNCCRAAIQALVDGAAATPATREIPIRQAAVCTASAGDETTNSVASAANHKEERMTAALQQCTFERAAPAAESRAENDNDKDAAASAKLCVSRGAQSPVFSSPSHQRQQLPLPQQHWRQLQQQQVGSSNSSGKQTATASAINNGSSGTTALPLEKGELCTVLLGLRGLLQQQQFLCSQLPTLEELQRQLQYRLVRVAGVSSVTITLNTRYLQRQLLLAAARNEEAKIHSSDSPSSCNDSQSSSNGRNCQNPTTTTSNSSNSESSVTVDAGERNEQIPVRPAAVDEEQEEGDGVAVLLMRLSSNPQRRLQALKAVKEVCGPLTLILRATRVYEHRRGPKSSNSRRTPPTHATTTLAAAEEAPAAKEAPAAASGTDGDGGRSRHEKRETAEEENASYAGTEADDQQQEQHQQQQQQLQQRHHLQTAVPVYLDEEQAFLPSRNGLSGGSRDEEERDECETEATAAPPEEVLATSACAAKTEPAAIAPEDFHGWCGTAAGFSFFSRNSVLFTQSRHLGNCMLPYEDDEKDLAERLKKEKEKKQLRQQQQERDKQTVIDRVLGNIGNKVRFW